MENTDFKLNRETFTAAKTLLEGNYEQSVEKDFVLPDYYPDIFRILKCFVMPRIISHSINGDKLTFEAEALIRVLYVSENDNRVNCIEQKAAFSKTADLTGVCRNPSVTVTPKCDYVNCRVVNQRRLDIRGAVTSYVKVVCEESVSVVTDAFGGNIQLKKQLCNYPAKRLTAAKRITVIDKLELADNKPAVGAVIRCDGAVNDSEQKMIAGKLITKGEAEISLLYTCTEQDGSEGVESMRFTLPFSQIIDIDGIDDSFDARVDITVASCDIIPKGEDGRALECELVLLVGCEAVKYASCEIVTDAYSTRFECEMEKSEHRIPSAPVKVKKDISVTSAAQCSDESIGKICDVWSQAQNVTSRYYEDKKAFAVSGSVKIYIMGCGENGAPFFFETETPFEDTLELPEGIEAENVSFDPKASVIACSYRLSGDNTVEVKTDIRVTGCISASTGKALITNITLDAQNPKKRSGDYALKLCSVNGREDIWEIAKKYSTSVSAILEENDLDPESTAEQGMLLIPLMN